MGPMLVGRDDRALLLKEIQSHDPLPDGARVRVTRVVLRDELPLIGKFGTVLGPHLSPKLRILIVSLDGESRDRAFIQYELELIDRLDYTTVDEGGVI